MKKILIGIVVVSIALGCTTQQEVVKIEPQIQEIYHQAKTENNISDYFKSLIYKIEILKTSDDFDISTVADKIKAELIDAPSPQQQILHSILAEVYVNYYHQNRWKIKNRTNIYFELPEDINSWTPANFRTTIRQHLLASVAAAEILAEEKLDKIEDILKGSEDSRNLRPTLYDLLAHRLIYYFSNMDLLIENKEYKSDQNLSYFFPADKFLELKINIAENTHPFYFILKIYQQVLLIHQNDEDKSAFINADLERLKFVKKHFLSTEKFELNYLNALNNIITLFSKHPSLAEVNYEKARIYTERGNRFDPFTAQEYQWEHQKAVEICKSVIEQFPESIGADYCNEMLKRSEVSYVYLNLKSVQLPRIPILASLDYRNCSQLYFRIVQLNFEEELNLREFERISKRISIYLNKNAIEQWSQKLPDNGDMQQHNVQIRIPELKNGYYILLASKSPDFKEKDLLHSNYFWVSSLSFVSRNDGRGGLDVFLLNRESGTPMQNVKLEVSERNYNYKTRKQELKKESTHFSDKYGFIHLHPQKNYNSKQFKISYKSDTLVEAFNYRSGFYTSGLDEVSVETRFFADRKIYRPGQTVYFKGIMVQRRRSHFQIIPYQKTKVVFYDANRQKISSQEFTSNEFGSFHGSFIVPENVLNGNMQIKNKTGNISFSVEEYKRPNFEILFDTLKSQYRINDMVNISGTVKTYSGSVLGDARVKFKISRSHYSYFKYSRNWYGGKGKQIFTGEIKTDEDGYFNIQFLASPDLSLDESLKMIYTYQLDVEVSDLNGETQSAEKRIPISYTNLKLSSSILEILEKNSSEIIPVSAVNFNGQKQDVNILVSVFKLVSPSKAFKDRRWNRPDQFVMDRETFYSYFSNAQYDDEKNKEKWEVENQVFQAEINTLEVEGPRFFDLKNWENGAYKMILKARDQHDEEIESVYYFTLYLAETNKLTLPEIYRFVLDKEKAIPGDTCSFVIGSYAKNVSVLYELQHNNKVLVNKRIKLNRQQKKIKIPITRDHIGSLDVNLVFVKDNEIYTHKKTILVSDPERELKINLETFRSILQPGQAEEWKIKISGNNYKAVAAELLCTMTDASLEIFRSNNWNFAFKPHIFNKINWVVDYGFGQSDGRNLNRRYYGNYFGEINQSFENFFWNIYRLTDRRPIRSSLKFEDVPITAQGARREKKALGYSSAGVDQEETMTSENSQEVELDNSVINIRKNFSETAFFYPDLQTDANGNIILKFTSSEALTRWKFMALAHTKDLKTALLEQEVVTQKMLMLSPNIPRFFRQGDTLYFNTKIISLSDEISSGQVDLQFFNAENMQKIETIILDKNDKQKFKISAKSSLSKSWKILIPDDVSALVYRLVASTKKHSDGEERMIPVLSNRMLVTESLPIHVNPEESKTLEFKKLLESNNLESIKHHKLKLEMTSNPNWYAIQALPNVATSIRENAIALFNRFYANAMANYILNANPRIQQIFKNWSMLSPDAFLSKLEKNQELKSVLLAETPWLMEAKNDSERKRRLALFFDQNTIEQQLNSSIKKLLQLQLPDGSWTWYKGGRGNRYITQYILSGILRLQHRSVLIPAQWKELKKVSDKAIQFLNQKLIKDYKLLTTEANIKLEDDHLRNIQLQYLFALSYADEVQEMDEELQTTVLYYLNQAQKYWMKRNNYLQGMIALVLSRNSNTETAELILRSLQERTTHNEELGVYWKQERGYYWYQAPIETQALLIEAFLEITGDLQIVSEMKKWLLKQKQTQMWNTPKASVEAINALFLEGLDVLSATEPVQVKLGGKQIEIIKQEAGTGYYEINWDEEQVKAEMGNIQLENKNKQIAWGALHWQYFEDLDKITTYETPLTIEKQLFIKKTSEAETVLVPLDENRTLKIGDKVVSRIVIRVDRDMEFVHLKDMRASAFEPRNVFSRYRYQNGLGYYESTKDAATHFYFDRLRKGTYVFEYEMFVSQKGEFSNGITTIQCMYAPEFVSHSEGVRVKVEDQF